MNGNKVVDLNSHHNQKLINEVEEIRKSNYDVIRMFPLLDNDEMLDLLYDYEEKSQLTFTTKYTKGIDPCNGFFGVSGYSNQTDDFITALFIRSTFRTYSLQLNSKRDELIKDEDGEFFETLPIVASIEYKEFPSPFVSERISLDDILIEIGENLGGYYFLALIVLMVTPYFSDKPAFKITSMKTVSLHDDYFDTDSLLQITVDNDKHHLLISIDITLCNKEVTDYYKRMNGQIPYHNKDNL